jgi:DNA-binding NarL/FixJ family response regulator
MHFSYATPDGDPNGMSQEALVIIDDEPFSQECLVHAIGSAFPRTPVLGFSTVEEFSHSDEMAVGLVLLRSQSPSLAGGHLTHETRGILQHRPDVPIVLLSMCTKAKDLREAAALGVRGIIPMTTSFKVAVAALQLVMVGGTYFPRFTNGDVPSANATRDLYELEPNEPEPLVLPHAGQRSYLAIVEQTGDVLKTETNGSTVLFTAREMDVLEALQKGWSNKWIAHSLNISENTIKVHIQRIMRKLHATNRTEAVIRHRQLTGLS